MPVTHPATTAAPLRRFLREERGLALTEYLILLGLLSGGVTVGIFLFSTALGNAWSGWTGFYDSVPQPSGATISAPASRTSP